MVPKHTARNVEPKPITIEFTKRGERELKGVPGSWRLFAVAG